MPTNKNAMTRYKILDELLSNRYHNYSLDDLTEEMNRRLNDLDIDSVTRRCVEKDIHYLEYDGPFLVDIERYSAPGYNKEKQKSIVKSAYAIVIHLSLYSKRNLPPMKSIFCQRH